MGRAGGKEVSILFKAGRMRFTSNLKSITFIYKMVLDMIEFQFGEYLYAICSETHKHNKMYADNKIHHLQTRISPECYLTAVSQDDT